MLRWFSQQRALWTGRVPAVKTAGAQALRRKEEKGLRAAPSLEETDLPAASAPSAEAPPDGAGRRDGGLRRPRVSRWVQAGLLTLGGLLIAIGIVGLVLPGIQGVVTILAGLVVVSLGSHSVHRWTRRSLRRWPRLLAAYERMRRRLLRRRNRRPRTVSSEPGA